MFAKFFNKHQLTSPKHKEPQKSKTAFGLNPRFTVHYGIPSTASRLAYDPIQQLLAIGTLDGRIKIIGGGYIEGLLMSPKQLPFKHLEFLHNQGFLASVSNENEIQVWDLEHRYIASTLHWESNITAFSIIQGTNFMYLADEYGFVSVLKYDYEERKLLQLPHCIPIDSVSEAAGISSSSYQSVVGVLPQPCSSGNRVLIAYENGIIVLWDVSEDQPVLVKGHKDLHLKDDCADNLDTDMSIQQDDQLLENDYADKEISSLCWASLDGSVLAVGYVDGDIMLWNLTKFWQSTDDKAEKTASSVIKLQLCSSDKRFPVIFLQWSASGLSNSSAENLFIYGGDVMGAPEVLTILSLDWSSGRDALKNVVRVNITLHGSFADMILLHNFDATESAEATSLFILSSPGQLQYYDNSCLLALMSQHHKSYEIPLSYRSIIPTTEPQLTIGRLIPVHANDPEALSQMASVAKLLLPSDDSGWPLRGGVPSDPPLSGDIGIERLYIAGYQDGSVRIWDATNPAFSLLIILEAEIKGINVVGATAPVSALEFSSPTLCVAVGTDSGLVRLYKLSGSCKESRLHIITGTASEVHELDQGNGVQYSAIVCLDTSPVCALRFIDGGSGLAIGFASGQVAMLDVCSLSVLFLKDTQSSPSSPILALAVGPFVNCHSLMTDVDKSHLEKPGEPPKELLFFLRRDFYAMFLDSSTGNVISSFSIHHNEESTALSVYILEGTKSSDGKHMHIISQDDMAKTGPVQVTSDSKSVPDEVTASTKDANRGSSSGDWHILLSCTNVLQLYSWESLIQGHGKLIHEVNLTKTSCWTNIFKKNEQERGLIVFYQTGLIEIRSIPNLEVLEELNLMSILRWNFKTNMEKTISSTDNAQIALVNGCEFAVISLLAEENDFRIPQSLLCLHDKVLAAAAKTDPHFFPNQKNNEESPTTGNLGGIVKGFRSSKEAEIIDPREAQKANYSSLESTDTTGADEVTELSIDDIEIDEPVHVLPLSYGSGDDKKDKKTDREKLFEGGTSETKPRQRTVEEIKAKYRKGTGDAAAAALQAKDKLVERQEKLQRINERSEELRSGAENFSSLAQELAKRMENRKWWQL